MWLPFTFSDTKNTLTNLHLKVHHHTKFQDPGTASTSKAFVVKKVELLMTRAQV
jgi:hypothetical protein